MLYSRVSDEKSARTYLNTIATRLKDDVDTLKGNFNMLNRVCGSVCCACVHLRCVQVPSFCQFFCLA